MNDGQAWSDPTSEAVRIERVLRVVASSIALMSAGPLARELRLRHDRYRRALDAWFRKGTPPPSQQCALTECVLALWYEAMRSGPEADPLGEAGTASVALGQMVLGKYRIERLLGKGGMGAVFAASHEVLGSEVALKVMLAHTKDAVAVRRFVNEARASAAIDSDHVARVLDFGQLENGTPFIAFELLEGRDLEHVLTVRGALPIDEAVDWVLQALEGLAHAHSRAIVHRDLKPANLFLADRADGTTVVKVLDFGVSKHGPVGPPGGGVTSASALLGSPAYMAPEQLRSAKSADVRSDIWALGVVLYELVTGRLPFWGESVMDVLVAVLQGAVPSLRASRPDVAPGLEEIVSRCLSRDLAERFQNVAELADALAAFAPSTGPARAQRIRRVLGSGPAVARIGRFLLHPP
jgi:serine/threonine-protein kinase